MLITLSLIGMEGHITCKKESPLFHIWLQDFHIWLQKLIFILQTYPLPCFSPLPFLIQGLEEGTEEASSKKIPGKRKYSFIKSSPWTKVQPGAWNSFLGFLLGLENLQ